MFMSNINISWPEIEKIISLSLHKLLVCDNELLTTDQTNSSQGQVGEWSIAHRLAVYLEDFYFDEARENHRSVLSVDCDYNKHIYGEKRQYPNQLSNMKKMRPDITIHERRKDRNNILAIEIKKQATVNGTKADKAKLSSLQKQPYGYKHCVFINFHSDKIADVECIFLKDGKWQRLYLSEGTQTK
jgi:hypothetical protein